MDKKGERKIKRKKGRKQVEGKKGRKRKGLMKELNVEKLGRKKEIKRKNLENRERKITNVCSKKKKREGRKKKIMISRTIHMRQS
jgi:hypothetical protein